MTRRQTFRRAAGCAAIACFCVIGAICVHKTARCDVFPRFGRLLSSAESRFTTSPSGSGLGFSCAAGFDFHHAVLYSPLPNRDAQGTAYQVGVVEFHSGAFVAVIEQDGEACGGQGAVEFFGGGEWYRGVLPGTCIR